MFLKAADKKDIATGKRYKYFKLCESYRIGNKTRHRSIHSLGKLEEVTTSEQRKLLADRIEQLLNGEQSFFGSELPPHLEKLARYFYGQIKRKKQVKTPGKQKKSPQTVDKVTDFQEVDLNSVAMEDAREIGCEWLCKQAIEELEIDTYLKQCGWEDEKISKALIHIISKATYPASEHKTEQWIHINSAVTELFNMTPDSISRFHLYHASDMLFQEKEGLEEYLLQKTNELFDLDDKLIMFDLTNTYFEGRKAQSKIAKFGRSKEKRNDAKLVVLALVVNREGFVKYSKILRGNIADCKTLKETINHLSERTSTSGRKPTVVIDAGIAIEGNLDMLKSEGYPYVCVNRSKLKDYKSVGSEIIKISDKRENPIEIRWVEKPDDTNEDRYLYVRSEMKAVKEASMDEHFSERYEEELTNLAASIHKKGGTKKHEKVMERIGRIKERYSTANKHYEIKITAKDGIATEINWSRKPQKSSPNEGIYFLRTSLKQSDEKELWTIYNTIREIEEAFRILKTDLKLRPNFHKRDQRAIAHINLAVLAYMVLNTIRYRLKSKGIHHDWTNIVRIMNTQIVATVTMTRRDNKQVNIRTCSVPATEALEIYSAMGYRHMPFYRKIFVLPE